MKDESIKRLCSFTEILQAVSKDIQYSRYEDFIIKMALAYDGYTFDLPAFLDFRGRIYRSGNLHFHERDLARSLILFSGDDAVSPDWDMIKSHFYAAAAFWLLFWKFIFLAKYVLPSFSFPRNGYRWAMGGRVSCDTNRSNEANNIFLSESIRLGFCDRRLFFHPPRKWLSLLIDRIYSRRITLLVFTIILKFLPN